jgi:H+/Cl- antiporter ClcA
MGYAAALGVVGGFAALAVLEAIKFGGSWYTDSRPGWFGGHWWWAGVTGAAGLVVGLLRRVTRLPQDIPGFFEEVRTGQVDPKLVMGTVAASLVSLIAGASVGPEKVLATMGGGAGSWVARRRLLDKEDRNVNSLSGIAAIFGGVFSSPLIVVMLIVEVARPGGRRFSKTLTTSLVAASISFGVYFAIAGAVFLGAYQVPRYAFEDWQLLAAIPLGLFGSLVAGLLAGFMKLASRLFAWLKVPAVAKSTLGGLLFGVVGVALPLTMFLGGDQLSSVLKGASTLGVGLCVAILIAKMLTYAISQGSGFVGGPIFPSLFIGGTAGVVVHEAIPGVPLGLAFSCLLTAVLGTIARAPFAMVLMTEFLTRAGALQTAPILIAGVTAFLGAEAVKYLLESRRHASADSPPSPYGTDQGPL